VVGRRLREVLALRNWVGLCYDGGIMQRMLGICLVAILMIGGRTQGDPTGSKVTVAVLPFNVLAPAGNEWLGRAMQEGLATNLQKSNGLAATIVAGLAPVDANAAITQAKSASGAYVLFGSIQLQDDQMRVTGQIISLVTGQSVGSFKSDGLVRDLFNIEDLLGDRCQRLLSPPKAKVAARSSSPAPALELVGPTISSGANRYFDGNLMAEISPPADPYRDDYDRYYLQSADTSSCGYYFGCGGWGFPCYGLGGGWLGGFGHMVSPVAAPISGW
jgi:TolB-like protein